MIHLLFKGASAPTPVTLTPDWRLPNEAVWIDLYEPTREEELAVEAALGLLLPTREEMAEIETSSRLYHEGGALYMTAQVVANSDGETPVIGPVTFVLAGDRLVTIRYIQPKAIGLFLDAVARQLDAYDTGVAIFVGVLDEIVDRLADVIERATAQTEEVSRRIFSQQGKVDFRYVMRGLGRIQQINAKIRESASSLTRLVIFCSNARHISKRKDCAEHMETIRLDLASIIDHTGYLSGNITFLLDAALGMINIEQNAIIKIFSIGAVIFLPPTLIASYFGMNFDHMAIFQWRWGELAAFSAMLLSALAALWWFKRKGWF